MHTHTLSHNWHHLFSKQTNRFLIDWIKDNQIMESIFGPNLHPDILKRAVDIPRFLAMCKQLDRKYLDMIWDAAVVHIFLFIFTPPSPQFGFTHSPNNNNNY
jgi:hypothetical protein